MTLHVTGKNCEFGKYKLYPNLVREENQERVVYNSANEWNIDYWFTCYFISVTVYLSLTKKLVKLIFLWLMENEGNKTSHISEIRFEPDIGYQYEISKWLKHCIQQETKIWEITLTSSLVANKVLNSKFIAQIW